MRHDDHTGCYVIVAEWNNQAPIVMETEGRQSSYAAARERMNKGPGRNSRSCIARLTYVDGNELVLLDLKRLQANPQETEE